MTLHIRSPLISPHICVRYISVSAIASFAQLQRKLDRALPASRGGEKPCGLQPCRFCHVFAPCRQARSCCLQRLSWLICWLLSSTAEGMVCLQGLELSHSSAGELGARRESIQLPRAAVVLHPLQRRILKAENLIHICCCTHAW